MGTFAEDKFGDRRYHALLGLLFLRLGASPFLLHASGFLRLLDATLASGVLFAALLALTRTRRQFLLALAPGVLGAILVAWAQDAVSAEDLRAWASGSRTDGAGVILYGVGSALSCLFLFLVAAMLLVRVVGHRVVTLATISGALCVFLMMAYAWGQLYGLADLYQPGSFSDLLAGTAATDAHQLVRERNFTLQYFSFVTITTLGYGDIQPLQPVARMLATAEAVVGQIFLVVLVARLVGLMSSRRADRIDG